MDNKERFWNWAEFKRFMLYFTFFLVFSPMAIGIKLALAENNMPGRKEIRMLLIERSDELPGCLLPYRPYFICRFGRLY